MSGLVVDTHVLVWMLISPARLSPAALTAIRQRIEAGERLRVPTICLVEVAYLIEKRRLGEQVWERIRNALLDPGGAFVLAPLDAPVAEALRSASPADVPDMPDRIIAATALQLRLPLVTRDRRIAASSIETIW